jgi:hypothetical protein
MFKRPVKEPFINYIRSLDTGRKFLFSLWLLFFLLVAFGIHGSSTGVTSDYWAKEMAYTGYLFDPPQDTSGYDASRVRCLLMANARLIRWDELMVTTPIALSQLSHNPRFPVVNTNLAGGQNILISHQAPVWHIATLARPQTWGYFFLGAQRGLAWFWWFQVFACFTALYLLLEIILKGHKALAAFGAFWFCGSAYVVCWSLWPAQITFFAALACLSAYRLASSEKLSSQIISAILLGLSIPGFVMFIYPPWQVSLGYLFLLIFIGLFIRDRLYVSLKAHLKQKALSLVGALALGGGLTLSFILTCLPDLKIMSNTVYPGSRLSLGGDYSLAMIFKGLYNLLTIYTAQPLIGNESEAASFYYLFPAVFLGILMSKRLFLRLTILGWLLAAYLIWMLLFLLVGLPETIARLTMMSYVPPYRADIAIGLASIILCVYTLAVVKESTGKTVDRWAKGMLLIASAAAVLFFIYHGVLLMQASAGFPSTSVVLFASLIMGLLTYCLLGGKSAAFCSLMGAIVVATTAVFNPLATNLDHIYKSELANEISRINRAESGSKPLWLTYGGTFPGVLITTLGGRSLSGIHWPPQLSIWRRLDPTRGSFENFYNRYAEVTLHYIPEEKRVSFANPIEGVLTVGISPYNPGLKELGARYVLAMGEAQTQLDSAGLITLYKSARADFTIYSIPGL